MAITPTETPWCAHERRAVRRRRIADGRSQFWEQCLDCGTGVRAVRGSTDHRLGFVDDFDDGLKARGEARRAAWWEEQAAARSRAWEERRAEDQAVFRRRLEERLDEPSWRVLRARVFERAGGVCEGCRQRRAVEVHHQTYDRLGDEMLFDLVALCHDCHVRLHPHMRPNIVGKIGRMQA